MYIEKWLDGEKIRGIDVSLYNIDCCIDIYNAMVRKEKPVFINEKAKEILARCNIKTIQYGIGWKIV